MYCDRIIWSDETCVERMTLSVISEKYSRIHKNPHQTLTREFARGRRLRFIHARRRRASEHIKCLVSNKNSIFNLRARNGPISRAEEDDGGGRSYSLQPRGELRWRSQCKCLNYGCPGCVYTMRIQCALSLSRSHSPPPLPFSLSRLRDARRCPNGCEIV